MTSPSQTAPPRGQWRLWLAGITAAVGLGFILAGLGKLGVLPYFGGETIQLAVGWGAITELLTSLASLVPGFSRAMADNAVQSFGRPIPDGWATTYVSIGVGFWIVGWAGIAVNLRRPVVLDEVKSEAVGKPLFPRLANYRDFHFGTLFAYGLGIFLSAVALIVVYLALAASTGGLGAPVQTDKSSQGMAPVAAFLVALLVGTWVAFFGGFVGAARAKRLSIPEATIAILYFGLPVPILLTLMHFIPGLMFTIGLKLREIAYLSAMLGETRPELGYWLVFAALVLALFLGICGGFVATSSGRLDLHASYENFISTRHVAVFRWRLLLGVLSVLILGILPPLILYFIVAAAQNQVERTRIKLLGLKDPLVAAEAVNTLRSRQMSPTGMMTALSVGGVGVGVMALIIVLSVMSGFEVDLQEKILGTHSHGVVSKYGDTIEDYQGVMEKVRTVRGVTGVTPFILNEVMVSSEGIVSGAVIKGVDPETIGSVTDIPSYLLPGGKLEWLDHPDEIKAKRLAPMGGPAFDDKPATEENRKPPAGDLDRDPVIDLPAEKKDAAPAQVFPGVILGKELASSLKVVVGDRINVISPLGGEMGPTGPVPKSRAFRVAGIFYSGMFEYDAKFVYISLKDAQQFFNVKGAGGIDIKVDDVDNARRITHAIYDKLDGYPYRVRDWGEMNHNLFAALRLEKLVMAIILSVIVIVAAGLIVATVIMLVLEKRKEIAVLKALGVPDGGVVKIFLMEGLQIGVAGGLLGLIAGLAWCLFIEKVGIKLDPQIYYIPALPVRIEPFQTGLSVVIAILVTFLASIYPALKASQVEPVEGLKAE
ncbi:MAG: ABC transporter permease [Myxococcaceae bacterium]